MKGIKEALSQPDTKKSLNRTLFNRIARKYDDATRLLSLGRDSTWKDELVSVLAGLEPDVCLDLASGTGDIASKLKQQFPDSEVIGFDLSEEMIAIAEDRYPNSGIEFIQGDICEMPFDDEQVDVITGGYALRNVPELEIALQEIFRILKPDGMAYFLEFVQADSKFKRFCFHSLLHIWGGLIGVVLHGDASIYRYIPESLNSYRNESDLQRLFEVNGFTVLGRKKHFLGMLERIELKKVPA